MRSCRASSPSTTPAFLKHPSSSWCWYTQNDRCAVESTAGPGPVQARYRWLSSIGRTQDLPGSWRIHPVPLLRSGIPVSSSRPRHSAPHDAAHTLRTVKALAAWTSRDSITQLRYPLPTLQAARCRTACKARFRPVANLCREGVEPSGFHRKVSILSIGFPPSPGFPWRERKIHATTWL